MNRGWQKGLCLLLLITVLSTLLSGCWDKKELNQLAVVMALGIDMHKDGYQVTVQVIDPNMVRVQNSSGSKPPAVVYKAIGKTIPEALMRMMSTAPRLMYLSHIRVLVVGEKLARAGLADALDFLSRNYGIRTDFFLLVAKGSMAESVLEVITPFEQIPANALFSSIQISSSNWAATEKVTLQQFITEMSFAGSNPILSGVVVVGKLEDGADIESNMKRMEPETKISHVGIAIFKRDKLVGWLNEQESKGAKYILNRVNRTVGKIECPDKQGKMTRDNTIGTQPLSSKGEIKFKGMEGDSPVFVVQVETIVDVSTIQCNIDIIEPGLVDELEKIGSDELQSILNTTIKKAQKKLKADIFGFGEELHRKDPKVWAKIRNDWEDYFSRAKIEVDAEVIIRRVGSIIQPLRKEVEER